MKFLVLGGSLRRASLNNQLAQLIARDLTDLGGEVDLAMLRDFPLPHFDQDLIDDAGGAFPGPVEALKARLVAAQAFVCVTPEYNYSVAAPVKNAIDWLSRYRPVPFRGKPGLIASASTSVMGGIRGLWQTRIPLEGCGTLLWPDMFALPTADKKLDATGLTDRELAARLRSMLESFVAFAGKVA